MSKLDKRLPNDGTKFGDHLSIISVGNDVQRFFYFWLKWLLKGGSQSNMSKFDRSAPKNATKFGDHSSISSVEIDV
jgi:hypothetical protein